MESAKRSLFTVRRKYKESLKDYQHPISLSIDTAYNQVEAFIFQWGTQSGGGPACMERMLA